MFIQELPNACLLKSKLGKVTLGQTPVGSVSLSQNGNIEDTSSCTGVPVAFELGGAFKDHSKGQSY